MTAPRRQFGRILCTLAGAISLFFTSGYSISAQPAGRVVGWGDNFWGQTNTPPEATNITAISARGDFNMALHADGQVRVWGAAFSGQFPVPGSAANSIAISAGSGHCVSLRADGRPIAWGQADAGQTNVPPSLTNATAVAAGEAHSLAVQHGVVTGWGSNTRGQRDAPGGLNGVTAVAAGSIHSVALRNNGTVSVWGDNLNAFGLRTIPPGATSVKAIASGANHILVLRSNGTVVAWGANNAQQSSVPPGLSGVIAIGAGDFHSLAVLTNGTVVAWGSNSSGQRDVPTGTTNIIAVSGGLSHSLALRLQPLVITAQPQPQSVMQGATVNFGVTAVGSQPITYQWRRNNLPINNATNASYSLFNVTTNDIAAYSVVVSNPLGSVTSSNAILQVNVAVFITQQPQSTNVGVGATAQFRVAAGGTSPIRYQWRKNGTNIFQGISSTFSIVNVQPTNQGNYSVVVSNDFGMVTSQTAVLTVSPGPGIIQHPQSQSVVAGSSVTFNVVATDAQGYEWRKNDVPIANATNTFYAIVNVQQSDAGNYSVRVSNQFGSTTSDNATLSVTMPASSSTRVVGWGEQLVWNGTQWIDVSPPPNLGNVVGVAVGGAHSLALRSDGTVIGWGDNTYGQAGSPPEATNVVAIAAGLHHSVALRANGTVFAWGRSDNWQQTIVPGHSGVRGIAAGGNHSLGVQSNGVVIGWGRNDDGRSTPHPTLGAAIAVGAGTDHSLGVRSNSTVRGWGGQNLHGETLVPAGLSNVMAVAGGMNHSMALRSNGTVIAWGNNAFGQTNVPALSAAARTIAAGANHCLALLQNGRVVAWGNGNDGQTNMPDLAGVLAIAAGGNRSLAVVPRQLAMQRPERLPNGRYRLTIGNDNGSPVTPEQLAKVQVFGSTNLVSTLASWIQLTNPLSIVNGSIRIEDSQTNLHHRFYRARENP